MLAHRGGRRRQGYVQRKLGSKLSPTLSDEPSSVLIDVYLRTAEYAEFPPVDAAYRSRYTLPSRHLGKKVMYPKAFLYHLVQPSSSYHFLVVPRVTDRQLLC